MVWQASPAAASAFRSLRFGLLAFVAAFVAHDAVFAVHYGFGSALGVALLGSGHGGYWVAAGVAAAAIAGLLVGAAAMRVGWLRHRLRVLRAASSDSRRDAGRLDAPLDRRASSRPYRTELLGLWLRLFAVVAVAFTVQENVEHAAHHHVLGIGALWSQEYPFAAGTLAAVTFVAAAIGAIVRCRIAALDLQVARASAAADAGAARRPRGVRPPARLVAHCRLRPAPLDDRPAGPGPSTAGDAASRVTPSYR